MAWYGSHKRLKTLYGLSNSASLQVFATIFTCIIGGILGEYLGRKTVCSIGSPIFLASFLCVTFAPTMHLLFFGQVIAFMFETFSLNSSI